MVWETQDKPLNRFMFFFVQATVFKAPTSPRKVGRYMLASLFVRVAFFVLFLPVWFATEVAPLSASFEGDLVACLLAVNSACCGGRSRLLMRCSMWASSEIDVIDSTADTGDANGGLLR